MKLWTALALGLAACTFDTSAGVEIEDENADAGEAAAEPDAGASDVVCLGGDDRVVDPDTGHCYMRFDQRSRWDEARTTCDNIAAHLVTIADARENDLVVALTECATCRDRVWLGLNDEVTGEYEWPTAEPVAFTNWRDGSPDSSSQHCVAMYTAQFSESGDVGTWNDRYCGEDFSFVCERSAD